MDFPGRKETEKQIAAAVLDVFKAASSKLFFGIEAVNSAMRLALKKYVGPIFEAVARRVTSLFVAIIGKPKAAEPEPDGPYVTDWDEEHEIHSVGVRSVKKQIRVLGDQMSETNRKRWERRQERLEDDLANEGLQEWADSTLFAPDRAATIAVTELTSAVSNVEIAVANRAEELGIVQLATWVTAKDDRVCPICAPLDGLGERSWRIDFPSGPPAHINCRCYLHWYPLQ
jgi:hypothetical protein